MESTEKMSQTEQEETSPPAKTPRRKMTNKRALYYLAVALLVLAFGGAVAWVTTSRPVKNAGEERDALAATADPSIVTVEETALRNIGAAYAVARMRMILQTIQATGSIGPNETRLAHIRPLARGRIEKVYVRLGDRVRAGQPLLDYDNIELGELIGEYLSAVAGLGKANAEAEVTNRSLERARKLVELGAVAKAEYERRNAEYTNALASINIQKSEIAKVEEKIHRFGLSDADLANLNPSAHKELHREASHSVLRAPFDGIVIKYDVSEGEVVETDRELFTVADLSTVWVQADVYEKDIASIHKGQEVRILVDAYAGENFAGKITYVSDFLDPKTRTAKVRCEVSNRDGRLKLEMFATIQISTPLGGEVVMIPTAAVQQIDDKPVAFVRTSDTQFQKRDVQLGARSDDWVEVKSGVKTGEVVVTQGSFHLKSMLLREQIGEGEER